LSTSPAPTAGNLPYAVLSVSQEILNDATPASTHTSAPTGDTARTCSTGWLAFALILAILLGFLLRILLLDAYSLREDEALYGFWARSFWSDPRYLSIFPDKPPIFLWLQAVALALFGSTSAAARLVSIFASTATIALVAVGARGIWRGAWTHSVWASVAAAWLLALSPFAIAFGSTGYTDSLLVFWGTAAIVLALRGRLLWAGALVGAAIMTKQQGVFYLPLVLGLAVVVAAQSRTAGKVWLRAIGRVLGGCALVLLPILAWDASRWAVAPSPWDLGAQNYTAIGLVWIDALAGRLRAWSALLWYGAASWWALGLYLVLAVLTVVAYREAYSRRYFAVAERWVPLLLLLWVAGFLAAHLFSTVPPWDRYLLPIFPALAMLLAGGAGWLAAWLLHPPAEANPFVRALLAGGIAVVLFCLLPPAIHAARGNLAIGADHGDYNGLDEAARWVEEERAASNPISVYHRALGWNLNYALFDAIQNGSVEMRWFPNGVYLADNVVKNSARRTLVIEPDWAATGDLQMRATMRGLTAVQVARFGRMSVWEIAPTSGWCEWCVNRLPPWQTGPAGPMSAR